jgi:non-homologous end joining protein Ku
VLPLSWRAAFDREVDISFVLSRAATYEVRSENDYFDDIQDVKVTKDMLDLAKHIVNQKSGHFEREI